METISKVFWLSTSKILFEKVPEAALGEQKALCMSVREFKVDNNAQRNPDNRTYVSHSTPAGYSKVVGLVGKRCMVHCQLNGQKVHSLWDTGAQVSLISKRWLDEHLPDLPLRNIESLLDDGTELDLKNCELVMHVVRRICCSSV